MSESAGNIIQLFSELKGELEQKEFIKAQHKSLTVLLEKNKKLEEELTHLKMLLINSNNLLEAHQVERIIVTPEQALVDSQIELIRNRSLHTEMDLEEVKKFEILIKAKKLLKEDSNTIKATAKKVEASNAELLALVKKPDDNQ